jgi:hypothetical protein
MTTDDDEPSPPVKPDDPAEQQRYLGQLKWRYPDETGAVDPAALEEAVRAALALCPPLRIDDPKEVLRFLALIVLLTPAQKRSSLLTTVTYRVLLATTSWGARKRLRFIHTLIVGRPPPAEEPDFGVWFIADPAYGPQVTPDDLARSIFHPLTR